MTRDVITDTTINNMTLGVCGWEFEVEPYLPFVCIAPCLTDFDLIVKKKKEKVLNTKIKNTFEE